MNVPSAVVLSTLNVMALRCSRWGCHAPRYFPPFAQFASSVCGRVSAWTKKRTRERQVVRNFGTAAAYSQGGVMAKVTVAKRKPTQLQIANRAFEIYVSRGGDHGHDVGDWFEAERQLHTELQPKKRAVKQT